MITIERKDLPKITLRGLKVKDTFECAGNYYIVTEVYIEGDGDEDEEMVKITVNLETGEAKRSFCKTDTLRIVNLELKEKNE